MKTVKWEDVEVRYKDKYKMKTAEEIVELLKSEVRISKKCMREAKMDNRFDEARELQVGAQVCEFVLSFIRGEND